MTTAFITLNPLEVFLYHDESDLIKVYIIAIHDVADYMLKIAIGPTTLVPVLR